MHELFGIVYNTVAYDRRVTELIKRYLKAGFMENGLLVKTEEGSFQGLKSERRHGRYAVLDMEECRQYEKLMDIQKLMTELEKGRRSGEEEGYFTLEDVEKEFGIYG